MKKYEKPTLEVVQIRVEEDIAKSGNTTAYRMIYNNEIYMGSNNYPAQS